MLVPSLCQIGSVSGVLVTALCQTGSVLDRVCVRQGLWQSVSDSVRVLCCSHSDSPVSGRVCVGGLVTALCQTVGVLLTALCQTGSVLEC